MSRHGYNEGDGGSDGHELSFGRWRAQVASATRGKRGQAFFVALVQALDALPEKSLVKGELQTSEGAVCALGALARHKGIDVSSLDTEDHASLGVTFNIASQLAQETMFENDEARGPGGATGEIRWQRVRDWAVRQLTAATLLDLRAGQGETLEALNAILANRAKQEAQP